MDLSRYEELDWDPPEAEDGNLVHCQRWERLGSAAEQIVAEMLSEQPVTCPLVVQTAEFALVGPDRSRSRLWVVLFETSSKRGDWLRPVTGWAAEPAEVAVWVQRCGELRP